MDCSWQGRRVLELSLVPHVIGKAPKSHDDTPLTRLCRKGGPLAVTDANLLLGRLIPDYFPKIFGKSENESLDVVPSNMVFEELANAINQGQEKALGLDEIVYGFVSTLSIVAE
jgi:5-oxoprolinase (ATP-hydrolysing)